MRRFTGTRSAVVRLIRGAATLAACAAVGLAAPAPAGAQVEDIAAACSTTGSFSEATRQFCRLVGQAVEIALPRLGLAAAGGNPIPGTASTIGMRVGSTPRVSGAARLTAVWGDLPPIRTFGGTSDVGFVVPSVSLDGAAGILPGFSPLPTLGGVISLDALASIGVVPPPSAAGFTDDTPFTWALGARLGITRESFTFPGISVSGMYRSIGDLTVGDPGLELRDAFFTLSDVSAWSVRGTVGKRISVVGATAGIGYDRLAGDVRLGVRDPVSDETLAIRVDDFVTSRTNFFVNASFTFLILHAVAEAGWQTGGDRIPGELPAVGGDPEKGGAFFGGLALRLSI